MVTMRDLTERTVNFNYGYNMKCGDCGCITSMTSETYCANCPAVIHHGPNVTALRDERDPVLNDAAAVNAAWYHTTVHPGWPSCGGPRWPADLKVPGSSPDTAAHVLDRHENQALHLGTYEAAVESMLRKMCDEGMAGRQFWIFRVALRRGISIEPGYRDENTQEVSRVSQAELGRWAPSAT